MFCTYARLPFGAKFPRLDCFTHELGKEYEPGLIWISGEELYIKVEDISPYLCGMDLNLINLKGLSSGDFSKVHEINEVDNSIDLEIKRLEKILKEQDEEIDKLNGI